MQRAERFFNLNEVVCVRPSSAPKTSLDPAVSVQTPQTRKRLVSNVPPSAAVTDGRIRSGEAQRNTQATPRVGFILWVDPPICGGSTARSSDSSLFSRRDEMFVMGVKQHEWSKRKGTNHEKERKELKHACYWIEREVPSGHFVRMYTFRIKLLNTCEWSQGHEESEWSLMTSAVRRSLRRIRRSCSS